ncbi:CAAX protease self-immunity [Rubritalea squalenifaciens DSM 18772]|uniref:CAAX protease self-immunity n=1 Tax=Rubritalea squalenifaciens DSM 18772 TaxID=1123071 RepID=A0A1M6DT83_9BACT|nr:CAAX protease self-immunity [Rubritalea squalenifaciens DSM 18772]
MHPGARLLCLHRRNCLTQLTVKRLLSHELTKLILFVVLSFTAAAIIAPHLYTAGKDLAAAHAPLPKDPPFSASPTVWLAEKCDSAEFSRYFNRALMASALLLLYPLIRSLRSSGTTEVKPPLKNRINPRAQGWKDIAVGLCLSMGFLILLGFILQNLGWVTPEEKWNLGKAIRKAIAPAIIVSILEEWLFRGVIFDILMRKLSTAKTIISLSLIFAALHFLKPPEGVDVVDPRNALAGFEMLGLIGHKFLNPASFFGVFLTLFTVGLILAYTRHKTGYLWLSIGLHAGWIFSLKTFNKLTDPTGEAPEILFNENITDGLLPLATLVLTGSAVYLYLRQKKPML